MKLSLIGFFEFFQKNKGTVLNTAQELVVRILFNEPRVMEFLSTVGSGKTTLFDALEAYADNENPDYLTRAELFKIIGDLEVEVKDLKAKVKPATAAEIKSAARAQEAADEKADEAAERRAEDREASRKA